MTLEELLTNMTPDLKVKFNNIHNAKDILLWKRDCYRNSLYLNETILFVLMCINGCNIYLHHIYNYNTENPANSKIISCDVAIDNEFNSALFNIKTDSYIDDEYIFKQLLLRNFKNTGVTVTELELHNLISKINIIVD